MPRPVPIAKSNAGLFQIETPRSLSKSKITEKLEDEIFKSALQEPIAEE